MKTFTNIKELVAGSAFVNFNGDWLRICCTLPEEGYFIAENEDTGSEYHIFFPEVDLKRDSFYVLEKAELA